MSTEHKMASGKQTAAKTGDAVDLIIQDHRKVEDLFRTFEKADDVEECEHTLRTVMTELLAHTLVERALLYPEIRRMKVLEESLTDHADEEHTEVEELMHKLGQMDAKKETDEWKATAAKLFKCVRKHVEEEETDMLPQVKEQMPKERLEAMPPVITEIKKMAPKHPMPPKKLLELVDKAKKVVEKMIGVAGDADDQASEGATGKMETAGDIMTEGAVGDAGSGVKTRHQAKAQETKTRGGARHTGGKLAEPEQ